MTPSVHRVLNLDHVSLDGFAVHRLSATLRAGDDDPRAPKGSPWWVYLACDRISEPFQVSATPVQLVARLVDGRTLRGEVIVAQRPDNGYGTELILAGIGPLTDASA